MCWGEGGCTSESVATTRKLTHFEGLLRLLAGADGDEARPRHAAEALQVEPLQHRHGRHGVVLRGKTTVQMRKIENIFN